ncbi:MAG: FAD-dependent oxidoreductase [Proteobacteria bacterium]|nr:FAD-dependent oxidoreductase [Pseudomonadota bacterium]
MRYIIIGGSAAGVSAIEAIRSLDRTSQIELFTDEETPLYSRVLLTYYIAGAISKEELHFRPLEFFKENGVTPHLGTKVRTVSPDSKSIHTEDGKNHSFNKLLIATGSSPKVLDIPGVDKEGVYGLRNMEHAQNILKHSEKTGVVCILGGGLIGLRDGYALAARGLKVKMIVRSNRVLSQMLDEESSAMVQERLQEHGIEIKTGRDAVEILGNRSAEGVVLDNGEKVDCQMVIIGKGVDPNVGLVSSTGIEVKEGIVADEHMRTSVPDIYVAGDVAQTYDISRDRTAINAIWPCAFEQGRIAGLNMAGQEAKYVGSFRMNSLDIYGLPAVSMGVTRPNGDGLQEVKRRTRDTYRKLVLEDGRIVGAIFVGQIQKAGFLSTLLRKRVNVSDYVPYLMSDRFNVADMLPLMRQNAEKFGEIEYREVFSSLSQ